MKKSHTGLSSWQLTMMALWTVIGGSFFLGAAVAIHAAGPAILLNFIVGGALVYAILFALSEMTVADPAPGSFRTFAAKAYGSGAGFVVGWIYWTGMVLAMSSEAIAVSAMVKAWAPALSVPLMGSLIIVAVTCLNLFGADRLSKLESGLAAVKLLTIMGFIVLGIAVISGVWIGEEQTPVAPVTAQALLPAGLGGLAGSMLIVMFSYAGFEIIGLAASETAEPAKTVPQAITYTVFSLIGLYVAAIAVLLLLVPTAALTVEQSPLVTALMNWNFMWAGNVIAIVLVTAILSTMLAAMFGLGRMLRSLAEEGHGPAWMQDEGDIPRKGMLVSGGAMLGGLGLGLLLPEQVYLFLVSSGGFSLLFSYLAILLSHYKLRKSQGCPPAGKCQLPGYPITSLLAIGGIGFIIITMPLIPGQGAGLAAGLSFVAGFSLIFVVKQRLAARRKIAGNDKASIRDSYGQILDMQLEIADELTEQTESRGKQVNRKNRKKK